MENTIYIIPTTNKPVKVIFEENSVDEVYVERYKKTPQEVLKDQLKYNYNLRKQLTRQQIHSEYGKLRSDNYEEVINFLLKRGVTSLELNQKLNEVHEMHTFKIKTKLGINVLMLDKPFGIYEISK